MSDSDLSTDSEDQVYDTEEGSTDDDQVSSDDDEFELSILLNILSAVHSWLMETIKQLQYIQSRRIERPMRRPVTEFGYKYIMRVLSEDPEDFRREYRMFPSVFLKLCAILRDTAVICDTRSVSVEEMLGTFLLVVGQGERYCRVRSTFGRSRWTVSKNFNRMLIALNVIAPQMMAKPYSGTPSKIRESTRFYPYFKDCIGAMDGTHIPAMVKKRDQEVYRNRHGITSQNVLAVCNFDLEFIYVLSGWEGSAHDSKILNDAMTKTNGLKIPQGNFIFSYL